MDFGFSHGYSDLAPVPDEAEMAEKSTEELKDDTERLKADLADRERELEALKKENAHTKEVSNALWTHDIYRNARKKLTIGVAGVLLALSAFGGATVYQLYETGVEYVDGELRDSIGDRIKQKAEDMVENARKDMDRQISVHIEGLIADMKDEIEAQIDATQEIVEAKLATSESQATDKVTALVIAAEEDIKFKIDELERTIQDEGDALSKRVKEIRIAMTAPTEAKRAEEPLPKAAVDCDPNDLNADQIARVAIRQLSEGTGKFAQNGREVFPNTLSLGIRGAAATAEANCILDGIDRVVYSADPKWYRPSEFVRIDRENEYRFSISGWGPTELTAKLYFIGRRESVLVKGHLALGTAAGGGKRYLDDVPIDIQ